MFYIKTWPNPSVFQESTATKKSCLHSQNVILPFQNQTLILGDTEHKPNTWWEFLGKYLPEAFRILWNEKNFPWKLKQNSIEYIVLK